MKRIFLIVILSCSIVACKNNSSEDIGIIIPLSGGYSDVGHWMQMGIELAIEDLQTNYNININPIYEDSQSNPNKAISAYHKLKTTRNIKNYISTVSSVCLALKPLVIKDDNLLIVNAGHKDIISEDVDNIYRHALTIPQEAHFLADQLKSRRNDIKKISLLYTNNDIGVEFQNIFSGDFSTTDVKITGISYEEQETNLKNIVLKLVNSGPDVFVIYGYTKNFAPLIKTIRELNYNGEIYANQGFSTPSVIQNAGAAGNAVLFSDYDIPESDAIKALNDRAIRKYGQSLSPMSITSYNIMYLMGLAVINTKNDSTQTPISFLNGLQEYEINGMKLSISNKEIYVPLKLVENKSHE